MKLNDILLIDVREDVLQKFMECVADAGAEYGLTFNWKKLEVLPVRTSAKILKPDGKDVDVKTAMAYLGSLLSADGRITSELSRRIGSAQADFNSLEKVWKRSTLQRCTKIRIFEASICSKLSYGLFTAVLNGKERAKLDGFQARCLRRILHIPHAYYSRISNKTVLEIAGIRPLSEAIAAQQMKYWKKITARPDSDPIRNLIEEIGKMTTQKRRGRPRRKWVEQVEREVGDKENV